MTPEEKQAFIAGFARSKEAMDKVISMNVDGKTHLKLRQNGHVFKLFLERIVANIDDKKGYFCSLAIAFHPDDPARPPKDLLNIHAGYADGSLLKAILTGLSSGIPSGFEEEAVPLRDGEFAWVLDLIEKVVP